MAEKKLMATPNGVIQRLGDFLNRKDNPPTTVEVDQQIAAIEADQQAMQADRAQIEADMVSAYGDDTSDLEARHHATTLKLKTAAGALQRLHDERFQALRRAYLADYEQKCAAEQQHARRRAELKPQIEAKEAELAELVREYRAAQYERDLLTNSRRDGRMSLSEELKRSITEAERKQIEFRYGIANGEELQGAQRQAAGIPVVNPRIEQLQQYHDSLPRGQERQ